MTLLDLGEAVPLTVAQLDTIEFRTIERRQIEATFDVAHRVVAGLLLALAAPVIVALAMLVVLTSWGAPLYSQTRVGLDGRHFRMWKLRTMRRGADRMRDALADLNDHDGLLFKIRHDPRVTAVGRVLRRLSLDELPQLWNVVRGDMALIGPRPALPDEVEAYDFVTRQRLAVKPGLTGLWQVSGRSDLSWEESVALDLHYVANRNANLDAWILAKTLGAVLSRRGAY